MNVAVPKEIAPGERRVAVTPDVAVRLVKSKNAVAVQAGAGVSAGFSDKAYVDAGATISPDAAALYGSADFVLKVARPQDDEIALLRSGSVLAALLAPLTAPKTCALLAARGVTALAMELIPRISRAQSMDALSSQATVSGYKAAIYAADTLPKFFPMLMTAAGTIAPSKVLVLGAGVAGLQAIATARRLGAVVTGYDTRPVVKEQVESLGASFVAPPITGEGTGGYARELTADEQRQNREALGRYVAENDVVITTALVPGRRAPILITDDMLAAMRAGSVVVDLAAEAGGNTEGAQPGSTTVLHGVSIVAPLNVPSSMPYHASQLYARNLWA
ncbi:MAG TPA: NAD(P) transhydrogenase subunit alpha, partial [Candidatus Eremiobacteraceae bacterium]|nr:NAD(P) transhydrogenase subunit alpha [Candidatus Eremiobacteraceae bacterium]